MTRPFDLMRRLRAGVASVLLLSATGSYALNTATIVGSVASPDCLEYRVVGICYLAVLHLDRLHGAHVGQSAPLHPGCGRLQLQQYRRKPLGRGSGDEHAQSFSSGRW
ncbi:hypothetical protein SSTU70S_00769 [Stutzerimonas stutzeri]